MGVSSEDLKGVLLGNYDWGFLCKPRVPCGERTRPPPFFQKDEPISILLAFSMGLQHALAMVGGIITVPLLIGGPFNANLSPDGREYLVSASLIIAGMASFVQVSQLKIPFTRYVVGSGLLSVMGISFTFLPIAVSSISNMRKCFCNEVECSVGGSCLKCPVATTGSCNTGPEAYGRILGTVMVCCFLQIMLSFVPPKILRAVFPPVVSGTTVVLIGFALCATGFKYWGGGVYCADQVLTSKALCAENGDVKLPFGSRQYVGLGFVVFSTLVVVEIFGSPFMRNIQVVIGLFMGMIVASATKHKTCTTNCKIGCVQQCFQVLPFGVSYDNVTQTVSVLSNVATTYFSNSTFGNSTVCQSVCQPCVTTCEDLRFVTDKEISNAKWITFLWTSTYPIGFYAPAVLPMLFGFMVTTIECIGDITATTEASGLVPIGPEYETSVQGGILADGINSFFGACAMMLPPVTYAQNNGVIALTRCASRRAGIACAIILFTFGVLSKIAGIVLSIPDCILGGMTSFLFINVTISGMKILTLEGTITRRNRFIIAMALTIGVGVILVPAWANISGQSSYPNEGNLWPYKNGWSKGYRGFRDALVIVLSTGFSIGGFIAILLNLIIPHEIEDDGEDHLHKHHKEEHDAASKAPEAQKMTDIDV